MGYFPVRYDSRVINYDRRGFIRLATDRTSSLAAFITTTLLYNPCELGNPPVLSLVIMNSADVFKLTIK